MRGIPMILIVRHACWPSGANAAELSAVVQKPSVDVYAEPKFRGAQGRDPAARTQP